MTRRCLIRLWLDDLRPMPQGYDVHVTTAAGAISLLLAGGVTAISLDHDLGPPEAGTGYDVAKEIEAGAFHGLVPQLEWAIHSANPVGRRNMEAALRGAEKVWSQAVQ